MRRITKKAFYLIVGLFLVALIAAVFLLFVRMPVALPGHSLHSFVFDNRTRTYLLHLPMNVDEKPRPLLIVFHGGVSQAAHPIASTGLSDKADEKGFIVVYPNGTGRSRNRFLTWNAGKGDGYASKNGVDDVGFIRALLQDLRKEHRIDPNRIYATGISNGGMMAYRLACELPEVAAIGVVAGSLNYEPCQPSHPVSVIAFHGTDDGVVPYQGGVATRRLFHIVKTERVDKPVSEAIAFWSKIDGCSAASATEQSTNIVRLACAGGTNGAEVILYTLKGVGHVWPGGPRLYRFGDDPVQNISATDLMWEFFSQHPKQ